MWTSGVDGIVLPILIMAGFGLLMLLAISRFERLTSTRRLLSSLSTEFNNCLLEMMCAVDMGELDLTEAQNKCDFLRDLYVHILNDVERKFNGKKTEGAVRLRK